MPTIGRATIDVHYDGKGLEREARELGESTGKAQGEAHSEAFNDEAKKGFGETRNDFVKDAERAGRDSGKGFGRQFDDQVQSSIKSDLDKLGRDVAGVFTKKNGLDEYARKLKGVDTEYGRVQRTVDDVVGGLSQLNDAELISTERGDEMIVMLSKWEDETGKVARAHDGLRNEMDGLQVAAQRMNAAFDEQNLKDLITQEGIAKGASRDWAKEIQGLNDELDHSDHSFDALHGHALDYNDALDDLRGVMDRLNPKLEEHRKILDKIDATISGGGSVRGFRDLGREAENAAKKTENLAGKVEKLGGNSNKAANPLSKIIGALGRFDPGDNFGQALVLIVALLPQLAVLASAAAGGLLILGGAATALGLAAVGLALGFSNIKGPLKDLPADARPAAKAIQELIGSTEKVNGKLVKTPGAINGIRTALQGNLFDGLEAPIRRLTTTAIPALESGMKILGGALNGVLKKWLADLSTSDFKHTLTDIFTGVAPVIGDLGKLASNAFGIIGQLLIDVLPSVHEFTGELSDAAGQFLAFLKTPEGHKEVQQFLDDAKRVLKQVGDVLADTAGELAKLVTPKNIANTISVLQNLGKAAEGLAEASGQINDFIVGLGAIVGAVGGIAQAIGDFFDDVFSAVDAFVISLQSLLSGTINAVVSFGKGVGDALGGIGTGFDKLTHGDIEGGLKSIHDGLANSKKDFADFGTNVAQANGNLSAYFDALPAKSKSSLTTLAGNLHVSQDKVKEFGGTFAALSDATGVSLDRIAGAKSWTDLQNITGLSAGKLRDFQKEFGNTADKGTQALATLKTNASTNLTAIESKTGVTGKAAAALAAAIQKTAGDSKSALSGLAGAKSWDDIISAAAGAGSAAKTKMANNIIDAANKSGASIDDLPPKIRALVSTYGTIPKSKNTDLTAKDDASATIRYVQGLVVKDKAFTIRANYVESHTGSGKNIYTGSAIGGVMAGGKQVLGGKALAFAGGGVLRGPQMFGSVLAGEAGAEAIVPLTGPLSAVDASVRQLSAYARGKVLSGGSNASGSGRQVTVAQGAVQVVTNNANAGQVASAVLDRLVPQL